MIKPLLAAIVVAPALAAAAPIGPAIVKLWEQSCASCHGSEGDGDTRLGRAYGVGSFRDEEWQDRHDDAEIRRAIEEGKPTTRMRAFGDQLTADQVDGLVAFIRTFDPSPKRKVIKEPPVPPRQAIPKPLPPIAR
ncbi:c-type cytochrome [Vulgatibacter incomptus]|uniref:Cytochrome c family protein n=1 Tax=Vulgatibacter incomptus TaxID=1391653 RepID=A0A0K1P9C9_9BACT|nr:cytochrome c [Vulgatibacter incomptus]AKU90117.1 Cytochrome c family protein [Vulgatibacter incomptus]